MLSHANMWLGAVSVAQYLGLAEDDVTLAVLPLSFDYGQNQLLSTWYAGGSVVPLDFLRVPLIAVVGWMFFGERLDLWVFVGVLVILAGILWNLRQESRRIS